ncbi:MAG: fused MFS/spermidine synthase, partial [Candidatus Obscuribacterales bacterium]|nr:fused MFS/spermidine synthase [Candidatus Obscuribacterales bacterium]
MKSIKPSTFRIWLSICLLISGGAALVYELAWLRLLALAVGNTAYATSTILSIFLGGLALGAYCGGKFADQKANMGLKAYACLEICIGFAAPFTSVLLSQTPQAVAAICHALPGSLFLATALIILLSCLLLLPSTMLMGATLPVLMRFVQASGEQSKWFSWLYGINTLGAVLGSFSAALLGFAYLGILATTLVAGAFNVAVGMANLFISRKFSPLSCEAAAQEPAQTELCAGSTDAKNFSQLRPEGRGNPRRTIQSRRHVHLPCRDLKTVA